MAGLKMHRLSKSLEIRFRMASFSRMSLLTCPCLRRKRVEKCPAILEHLMTFTSSISTGKPEQLLSLMCLFFFGFLKSSLYFMRLKFIHEKAFRHFLTANSKKRFRRSFSYDFGYKQKVLSDFLASSSS